MYDGRLIVNFGVCETPISLIEVNVNEVLRIARNYLKLDLTLLFSDKR